MKAAIVALTLLMAGCGQIYIVPDVSDQLAGPDVTIVPLNAQTAKQANRSAYRPRDLPAVFFRNAGTGAGLVGAGAIPAAVSEAATAPAFIATRLPDPVPEKPYEIGVGDVVMLTTSQAARSIEEISGMLPAQNRAQPYTVQDDGTILVLSVGRVRLAGLTLEEAAAELFQELAANQLDPTFSIAVAEFNSKRVSVGGAVRAPAILPITITPLTLQEAIVRAGGPATLDTQFVTVRLYRDGTLYQVPLADLPKTDVQLVAGDSVYVDTDYQLEKAQAYFAEQITLAQLRQSARSEALNQLQAEVGLRRDALTEARDNFQARLAADAVDRDFVYLTGEVTEQGRFPMPFGRQASLADALFAQGGPIPDTGNPAEIYLLRGDSAGKVTAFHLNGANPVNLLVATDLQLRPNDIVFVAQQPVTRWNRVVQQLVPSLILAGATAVTN